MEERYYMGLTDVDRNFWAIVIGVSLIVILIFVKFLIDSKVINISALYFEDRLDIKTMRFIPESIFTIDEAGKIVRANNKALMCFGYSSWEIKKKPNISMIISDMASFEAFKILHSEEKDEVSLEVEAKRKNGELFPAEVIIGKCVDEENKNTYYIVIIKGIVHRKAAQETIRITRQQIDFISELCVAGEVLLRAGSMVWDLSTDEVRYSEGFRKLFKLRIGEEVKGPDILNMIYWEDRALFDAALLQAKEDHKIYEIKIRAQQDDGSKDLIRFIGQPILSPNGKLLKIRGAIILVEKNIKNVA